MCKELTCINYDIVYACLGSVLALLSLRQTRDIFLAVSSSGCLWINLDMDQCIDPASCSLEGQSRPVCET